MSGLWNLPDPALLAEQQRLRGSFGHPLLTRQHSGVTVTFRGRQ